MDLGDDLVFKALADPTRRLLLDALFEHDGLSLQTLCERCGGDLTRFAVMKHLGVLETANLVVTRKEGRTKRHFLNPVPIQQIADRWIGKYAAPFARAMAGLQHQLDQHQLDQQHLDQQHLDQRESS